MIIYAGTQGYLDEVPIKQVQAWEKQFLRSCASSGPTSARPWTRRRR